MKTTIETTIKTTMINTSDIKSYLFERSYVPAGKIAEIASSIKSTNGVIEPIIVRNVDGGYQLIAGYMRLLATKQAGMKTIEAKIYEDIDDTQATKIAIIENVQRQDMNGIDEARMLKTLQDNDWTVERIGDEVGKTKGWVSQRLALLKDVKPLQDAVRGGRLTEAHARHLRKITNEKVLEKVIDEVQDKSAVDTQRVVKETLKDDKARDKEAEIRAEIQEYKNKLTQVEEGKKTKAALEKEINDLVQEQKKLEKSAPKDLNGIMKKLSTIENQYNPLKEKLAQLQAEKKEHTDTVKKIDIDKTTKERDQLTRDAKTLNAKIQKLSNELAAKKSECSELNEKIKTHNASIACVQTTERHVKRITDEIEHTQGKMKVIQNQYSDEIKNYKDLRQAVNGHEKVLTKRNELFREIGNKKAEIRRLNGLINNKSVYQVKVKRLEEQIA